MGQYEPGKDAGRNVFDMGILTGGLFVAEAPGRVQPLRFLLFVHVVPDALLGNLDYLLGLVPGLLGKVLDYGVTMVDPK